MTEFSDETIAQFVILAGLIAAYRSAFGAQQEQFTEVVIKAFNVKSRYKGAVNVATSIAVSIAIGSVLAIFSNWLVIPIAAIAGLYASTKAAEVHDAKKPVDVPPTPVQPRTLRRLP